MLNDIGSVICFFSNSNSTESEAHIVLSYAGVLLETSLELNGWMHPCFPEGCMALSIRCTAEQSVIFQQSVVRSQNRD